MSTAVETPPLETTITPPAATPIMSGSTPVGVTLDLDQVLKGKKTPEKVVTVDDVTKDAAAKEAEAKKAEEAKKAAEAVKVTPPVVDDKNENLANLRKAREAAESEREALKTQLAELQKKFEEASVPKVPEDVQKKIEQYEKDQAELRKNLQVANLERDPDFQKKYNGPIKQGIEQMMRLAMEAGVTEKEAIAAVNAWDKETFGAWHESMSPVQKIEFGAALSSVVNLYREKQTELADADKRWEEIEKQREEQAKTHHQSILAENEKVAKTIVKELLSTNEALKEYEDLPAAAEAAALKAARYEMTPQEVFHQVAANQVLARVTTKQAKTIEELTRKNAELQKFVDEQASAVPKGGAAGNGADAIDDKTPLWGQIRIKT